MILRARHLLLGLVLLVPGGFAASQESDPAPLVAWQELLDHPGRYLGKEVRLNAQFYSRVESWNAFLTRFGTREFNSFQFWSDEQFPWVQAEYEQPRVRLFARRGMPGDWALAGAHAYARYELRIRVRELFLDLPWAEIETATPTIEEISEGTNIHAARGLELAGQGNLPMARTEFEHALEGLLPAHARAELERLRDACPAPAPPPHPPAPALKSGRK